MNAYQPKTAPSYGYDSPCASFQGTGAPIFSYDSSANYIGLASLENSPGHAQAFLQFTGKERDSESGLDYFGARYYGSALGRFSSPDPGSAGVDITDPQSWNAYAYVGNNPLAYTDSTGMAQEDANGSCKPEDGCFSVVKTVHLSWWEKLKSWFSGGGMAATIRPGNPMQYRRAWEKANPGQQFPKDASGNNLDADHDIPISEGGDPLVS